MVAAQVEAEKEEDKVVETLQDLAHLVFELSAIIVAGHTADCFTQVRGHKSEATFEDKMGGSTLNCPSTWQEGTTYADVVNNLNPVINHTYSVMNLLIKPPTIAKANSGASAHYFKPEDAATVLHKMSHQHRMDRLCIYQMGSFSRHNKRANCY